jgi:hypothetical protein
VNYIFIEVKHQHLILSIIILRHLRVENKDGRRVDANRPSDGGGQAMSTCVKIRFDIHCVIAVHDAFTTTTTMSSFTTSSSLLVYTLRLSCS